MRSADTAGLLTVTLTENHNNNTKLLVPLLKVIRNQRCRGSLMSTIGPSGSHQKCPRQNMCPVAKLLILLETGACLGPYLGTIAHLGHRFSLSHSFFILQNKLAAEDDALLNLTPFFKSRFSIRRRLATPFSSATVVIVCRASSKSFSP